jgi:hypothetical protein
LNKRYVTDAQLVDIGTIAGKLTGNVAIAAATKTKITYDTNGLVTSGADATTADIADSVNKRYCTDAEKTTITLSGKKDFTYEFSFCDNLAVGDQISVGCNHRTITLGGESTWQNNGLGVYIATAQKIVSICYCVPYFLSNNVAHQTTYDFREITADGSLTSDPTGASGSSIHTYSFVYANASGANRYYKCLSQTGLAIDINPGKMLTIWVSSQNVSVCHGVSIQVQTRES